MIRRVSLQLILLLVILGIGRTSGARSVDDFNDNWRFGLGDHAGFPSVGHEAAPPNGRAVDFDDASWQLV